MTILLKTCSVNDHNELHKYSLTWCSTSCPCFGRGILNCKTAELLNTITVTEDIFTRYPLNNWLHWRDSVCIQMLVFRKCVSSQAFAFCFRGISNMFQSGIPQQTLMHTHSGSAFDFPFGKCDQRVWLLTSWPLNPDPSVLFTGVKRRGETLRSALQTPQEMSVNFSGGKNCHLLLLIMCSICYTL